MAEACFIEAWRTARAPRARLLELRAATDLAWMNRGIFIGVAGRQPGGVTYETYLVE